MRRGHHNATGSRTYTTSASIVRGCTGQSCDLLTCTARVSASASQRDNSMFHKGGLLSLLHITCYITRCFSQRNNSMFHKGGLVYAL